MNSSTFTSSYALTRASPCSSSSHGAGLDCVHRAGAGDGFDDQRKADLLRGVSDSFDRCRRRMFGSAHASRGYTLLHEVLVAESLRLLHAAFQGHLTPRAAWQRGSRRVPIGRLHVATCCPADAALHCAHNRVLVHEVGHSDVALHVSRVRRGSSCSGTSLTPMTLAPCMREAAAEERHLSGVTGGQH